MSIHLRHVARSLMLFGVLGVASTPAFALVNYLDNFSIMQNAITVFSDTFSDGTAPPSGPLGPNTYNFVKGNMIESGGKLRLDSLTVPPGSSATGNPVQTTRASWSGVFSNSGTFGMTGIFDIAGPASMPVGSGYGVRLGDRDSSGKNNSAYDVVDIMVRRDLSATVVELRHSDFVNQNSVRLASVLLPLGGDQIALSLDRTSSSSNSITGSFLVLNQGALVSSTVFDTTGSIFSHNQFTRPEFLLVTPAVPEPEIWAMMLAGFGLVGLMARRNGKKAGAC